MSSNWNPGSLTERSINYLQFLFSVLLSLSVIKGVSIYFDSKISTWSNFPDIIPFLGLMIILIPFHQGASRYLDETYLS